MTNDYNPYDPTAPEPDSTPAGGGRASFPWQRLLYAIGFAILADLVLWLVIILAILQFVATAINGEVNEELKSISRRVCGYLVQLVHYIVFVQEERPFPFAPFPQE